MNFSEILLIGAALSMDAFAVCLSSGMVYPHLSRAQKLSMPLAFGLFQGLMPVAGFYLGNLFSSFINQYSGIIALVILGIIGLNMVKEGFSPEEEREEKKFTLGILLLQAFATSIDAFAIGVSFAATQANINFAAPIIALTTFFLSMAALLLGKKAGEKLGHKGEVLGGIILIIIGIKAMF